MEFTMPDDGWAIRTSNLRSLTPAQRGALMGLLVRRARQARARAIGAALLRLPLRLRALCRRIVTLPINGVANIGPASRRKRI
jgi:hypothetical protein